MKVKVDDAICAGFINFREQGFGEHAFEISIVDIPETKQGGTGLGDLNVTERLILAVGIAGCDDILVLDVLWVGVHVLDRART